MNIDVNIDANKLNKLIGTTSLLCSTELLTSTIHHLIDCINDYHVGNFADLEAFEDVSLTTESGINEFKKRINYFLLNTFEHNLLSVLAYMFEIIERNDVDMERFLELFCKYKEIYKNGN